MARTTAYSAPLLASLWLAVPALAQQPAPPAPKPAPSPAPAADQGSPEITVQGQSDLDTSPISGPSIFLSPMGEPFRSEDKLSGAEHWFTQADSNHNGRLTLAEYLADAMRFFAIVDRDHDGVIGPDEILHYETDIAPEVTVTSTWGDLSKMTTDSDGKLVEPPYPTRLGAGRYSYVGSPEPIVAADANFDRGITKLEFENAAKARFKALDRNGDGMLTRTELPKLLSPRLPG